MGIVAEFRQNRILKRLIRELQRTGRAPEHLEVSRVGKVFIASAFDYLSSEVIAESRETGIELIEMTGLADRAILVTSRWDEPNVRQRCQKLGLRLLPKLLAGMTPIHESYVKFPSNY